MTKVLVVEDEPSILNSYAFVFQKKGLDVTPVTNAKDALEACKTAKFDVIILDMLLPEISGLDFLRQAELKKNSPETKVLVISNTESAKIRDEAMQLGAVDYLMKVESTPYDLADKVIGLSASPHAAP